MKNIATGVGPVKDTVLNVASRRSLSAWQLKARNFVGAHHPLIAGIYTVLSLAAAVLLVLVVWREGAHTGNFPVLNLGVLFFMTCTILAVLELRPLLAPLRREDADLLRMSPLGDAAQAIIDKRARSGRPLRGLDMWRALNTQLYGTH